MKTVLKSQFILGLQFIVGCVANNGTSVDEVDYRQEMRTFVSEIGNYARSLDPKFLIVPQNGQELLTEDGEGNGPLVMDYISSIDGIGREDLLYGYTGDNILTPETERDYLLSFLDLAEENGVECLVTDYCWTRTYVDDSYTHNFELGFISFAADHRELDDIPGYPSNPYNVNSRNISSLGEASNFLYLLNPDSFDSRDQFLRSIGETNYDLIIMDLFYSDTASYSFLDISGLKQKQNGGSRMILAYMSIGEAEDYRYYWKNSWKDNPPQWLEAENPAWEGNYKVRYWEAAWQEIIYGNDSSYVKKILDSGFDGVYLDIIDAFEYFEGL